MRTHPSRAARIFPTELQPETRWRPDIQGLRGLSVLLVLAAHARIPGLQGGFIGVDVFFVLSGFLITSLIVHEVRSTGTLALGRFYARRARRILPAATLVLVTTVGASVYLLGVDGAASILAAASWTAVFLSNEYFAREGSDYFAAEQLPSPLQQFWSLAVEEQFYLLWPALFIAAVVLASRTYSVLPQPQLAVRSYARHGRAWLTAAALTLVVGSFAWSTWMSFAEPGRAYFSGVSRAWEIALGCSLALMVGRLPKVDGMAATILRGLGLLLILVSAVMFTSSTPFPGLAALIPVTGTLMVIAAGLGGRGENSLLTSAPLVFVGRISFSLYLWHWPFLTLYWWATGSPPSLLHAAALLTGAFVAAVLTTFLLEEPIRSSTLLTRRTGLTLAGAGIAVALPAVIFANMAPAAVQADAPADRPASNAPVVTVQAGASASDAVFDSVQRAGRTSPLPLTEQAWPPLSQLNDTGPAPSGRCLATPLDVDVVTCSFGDPAGKRRAAVIGDSHGAMWAIALDAWGKENSVDVTLVTKAGCTPADVFVFSKSLKRPNEQCLEWRGKAFAYLQESSPDIILVAESVRGPVIIQDGEIVEDEKQATLLLAEGMRRSLASLSSFAPSIVLIGDVPSLDVDLPACLAANRRDVSVCAKPWSFDTWHKRRDLHRQAVEAVGGGYVDSLKWFCDGSKCPVLVDNKIIYRDGGGHITPTYAEWLAPAFSEELEKALSSSRPATIALKSFSSR